MISNVDQSFSKLMKIQKWNYVNGEEVNMLEIDQHLTELSRYDINSLDTDAKKKTFWINVYNGLTNYWIIKKGIKKKMKEDVRIFIGYKMNIGGLKWSLDNIEHGILRCNAKVKYWPLPQFLPWDKRRKHICSHLDYRIHFALNCGANSCPPIAFFDVVGIEEQLNLAEDNFTSQEFNVNDEDKTILCSQIYSWYQKDFIQVYLNDSKYSDYTVVLKDYDWSIH